MVVLGETELQWAPVWALGAHARGAEACPCSLLLTSAGVGLRDKDNKLLTNLTASVPMPRNADVSERLLLALQNDGVLALTIKRADGAEPDPNLVSHACVVLARNGGRLQATSGCCGSRRQWAPSPRLPTRRAPSG